MPSFSQRAEYRAPVRGVSQLVNRCGTEGCRSPGNIPRHADKLRRLLEAGIGKGPLDGGVDILDAAEGEELARIAGHGPRLLAVAAERGAVAVRHVQAVAIVVDAVAYGIHAPAACLGRKILTGAEPGEGAVVAVVLVVAPPAAFDADRPLGALARGARREVEAVRAAIEARRRQMVLVLRQERERRAVVAQSEGEREAKINVSEGQKQETINLSEADKQRQINEAEGKAREIELIATATAEGLRRVAEAINTQGGQEAVSLRVAEQYVKEFGKLAQTNNTMILPAELSNIGSAVAAITKTLEVAKK